MDRRLLLSGLGFLVLLGTAAGAARAVFPRDLGSRMEPYRERILDRLALEDSDPAERAREVARFDGRFAAHPVATLLHVVPGAGFLLLVPLQLVPRLRTRHPIVHRAVGRLLLVLGAVTGLSGLYFGLLMPYAGRAEGAAIALFGGLFLLALLRAYRAIRRGDVPRHGEWMIRAFALALAISVVRVLGGVLDLTLSPAGVSPQAVFVLAIWAGWILSLGAAEIWIRRARRAAPALALAS